MKWTTLKTLEATGAGQDKGAIPHNGSMHYDVRLRLPLKQPIPYQPNIVEMLTTSPSAKKAYLLLGITSTSEVPSWPSLTTMESGSKFKKGMPSLKQRG